MTTSIEPRKSFTSACPDSGSRWNATTSPTAARRTASALMWRSPVTRPVARGRGRDACGDIPCGRDEGLVQPLEGRVVEPLARAEDRERGDRELVGTEDRRAHRRDARGALATALGVSGRADFRQLAVERPPIRDRR